MNELSRLRKTKNILVLLAIFTVFILEIGYFYFLGRDWRFVLFDLLVGILIIMLFANSAFYFMQKLQKQLQQEIEERKAVEATLQLRSRALEAAATTITLTDSNGRFLWVNPAFTTLTGYSAEEAIGQTPALLRSGAQDDAFYQNLWQTITAGQVWHGEIINKRKDGTLYTEEQTITPVLGEDNTPLYYIAIKHNITARKNAEETLRQYTERLQLINRIDQAILGEATPEESAIVALKYARQLIPYVRASVVMFDEKLEEGMVLAVVQDGETAVPAGYIFLLTPSEIKALNATAVPPLPTITEFADSQSNIGKLLKAEGLHTQVKMPLIAQNQLIGALNLATHNSTHFTQEHITITQEIATSLAIGLQQARLYQSERRQREQAEALRAIGEALNATLDFDEVLHLILDQLTKVVPYDSANILFIEGDTASIRHNRGYERYGIDIAEKEVAALTFRIAATPNLQTIIRSQEPLIIPDIDQYPGWLKDKSITQARSWVGVPIFINKAIVAIIALAKQEVNFYQNRHVNLLRAFASQASLALENARLYQELSEHASQLEARVHSRTRALAKANERLKELDRLKTKFISDVSHELRTPITNISMYLDLLQQGKIERQAHYMLVLKQETMRLSQIIEDIFDESRHTSHLQQADYARVDMNEIIYHTLKSYQVEATRKGLALTCDLAAGLPLVWGEAAQLSRVIANMLKNSIQYTTVGEVSVITNEKDNWVSILIVDTGVGISSEDMPHLFDRFYRGHPASQSTIPGTGLGLGVVREIVGLHGGSVMAANNERGGATFEILLPVDNQIESNHADI